MFISGAGRIVVTVDDRTVLSESVQLGDVGLVHTYARTYISRQTNRHRTRHAERERERLRLIEKEMEGEGECTKDR